MNTHKVGLVFAVFLGGFHAVWSLLVLLGAGQALINFVLWAHMIHMPYQVGPFDTMAALTLIAFTSALGYVMGLVAALAWKKIHPVT